MSDWKLADIVDGVSGDRSVSRKQWKTQYSALRRIMRNVEAYGYLGIPVGDATIWFEQRFKPNEHYEWAHVGRMLRFWDYQHKSYREEIPF